MTALTAGDAWVRTWGSSPQAANDTVVGIGPFDNATLWQLLRISGGGRQLRLRVSNEFGTDPLLIGAGSVALSDAAGRAPDGGLAPVTFSGRPSTVVPRGAAVVSGPIDLPVPDLSHLLIALHMPEHVEACTCHGTFHALSWMSAGDGTRGPGLPDDANELETPGPLTAVEVLARPQSSDAATGRSIVVIGDSRVDGIGSAVGEDRRWTDVLAERLTNQGFTDRFVVNHGISGNRLLADGIGPSVLSRFDRDVLATPGLGHVVIAVGNDLIFSNAPDTEESRQFLQHFSGTTVDADDVIAGHIQLAHRARMHGIRVFAATIAPYRGSDMYTDAGDAARRRVNAWIRSSGTFDAVLDFDAVWRDPDDPSCIRSDLHAGDHIHGNDAGYRVLAESIDLRNFS